MSISSNVSEVVMSEVCEVPCTHEESLEAARSILGDAPVDRLADSFRILGDATRVGILLALRAGELCVCDLAELFGVTPGAISHQLRLLKAYRLVRPRRDGKMVFYRLDDNHVSLLLDMLLAHAKE